MNHNNILYDKHHIVENINIIVFIFDLLIFML